MSQHIDVDQILVIWLADGGERAPERHVLSALEQVEITPQRRSGPIRPWISTMTQSPVAWGTALAAAVIIGMAVIFGSALVGDKDTPVPSMPTESQTPRPSASPSADSTSHRSETSLGTIDWTRITTIPPIRATRVIGDEILGYVPENQGDAPDSTYPLGPESWWTLTDAPTWERADEPDFGGAATFVEAGSQTLAIVSPDGYSVMMGPLSARQVIARFEVDNPGDAAVYRRVGAEWEAVPLPALASPAAQGLRISSARFEGGAALDEETWIVPIKRSVTVPWGDIYGLFPYPNRQDPSGPDEMIEPWPTWDSASERLTIDEPGDDPFSGTSLASLTVELVDGDPPMIEFRDATTAELVHTVPATLAGWTPESLLIALRSWGFDDPSFLVHTGGETRVIRPPWPAGEEWSDSTRIVTALGKYYAVSHPLGPDYSVTAIHLWESTDGLEWVPVDLPQMPTASLDWVALAGKADGMVMSVFDTSGSASVWATTDGRDWERADTSRVSTGVTEATDFGWLMNAFDAAAVSADGSAWEPIDVPPLPAEPLVQYLNGTFIYGPELVDDQYVTWIGHLAGGD